MHVTLDGFVAGPNVEMDWIQLDDSLFDLVGNLTDEADTASRLLASSQHHDKTRL